MQTTERSTLGLDAATILLEAAAKHLGLTTKQLCELKGGAGVQAYYEFAQSGFVPSWLEDHCFSILNPDKVRKALNLLGGTCHVPPELVGFRNPDPVMGLSGADMHDLEAD